MCRRNIDIRSELKRNADSNANRYCSDEIISNIVCLFVEG